MTTQPGPKVTSTAHILSPNELAGLLKRVQQLPEERGVLRLSGIFSDRNNEPYGDIYYDDLYDPLSPQKLTLLLSDKIKRQMRDGRAYVLDGFLERRVSSDGLRMELLFSVTRVEDMEPPSFEEVAVRRSDVFYDKCKRGFRHVESAILEKLLSGKQARLGFIYGMNAVVDKDVVNQLAGSSRRFEINWREVRLTSRPAIVEALRALDASGEWDLIGIVRGGGELRMFDDVELAAAASALKTPLVTAIGHAVDYTLCDQIADQRFDTPTQLGQFLSDAAAKAADIGRRTRELADKQRALAAQEAGLAQKAAQAQRQLEADRQALEAVRQAAQQEVSELRQKYGVVQEENRRLQAKAAGTPTGRMAVFVLLGLAIGLVAGLLAGALLVRRWDAGSNNPQPAIKQQAEAPPAPSPSPSPAGNVRRKRQ